jgi:hypothetical protein
MSDVSRESVFAPLVRANLREKLNEHDR